MCVGTTVVCISVTVRVPQWAVLVDSEGTTVGCISVTVRVPQWAVLV
jgi:hypothetical protein